MSILWCKMLNDLIDAWGAPLPSDWVDFGFWLVIAGVVLGMCLSIYYEVKGDE